MGDPSGVAWVGGNGAIEPVDSLALLLVVWAGTFEVSRYSSSYLET